MSHSHFLSELMAGWLSDNALNHLRAAGIRRHPELAVPAGELRGRLARAGFPVYDALIDLEARAGGAAFPQGRVLGAGCFLAEGSGFTPKDLPEMNGRPLFPVYGDPEHLAEWESVFGLLGPDGEIALYDAPDGPVPAFSSLAHFLEVIAFAPLSRALHRLRVDAFCGETLAGLLCAGPHLESAGAFTLGWAGADVWVQELRMELNAEWSSWRGTFVCTERPELLVDLIPILLEQGFALGHRGPVCAPHPDEREVLAFTDAHPEVGYRAHSRVCAWAGRGSYEFSHEVSIP
jgi:hypothetical protein